MSSDQILGTPVLPGVELPKHEHKHLVVLLVIVVVIAICVLIAYFLTASYQTPQMETVPVAVEKPQLSASIISQLENAPKPTATEVKSALKRLSSQKAVVTAADEADGLRKLQAQVSEQ